MSAPQVETRILDSDGDTVYAAGCGGVWLLLCASAASSDCVVMHAPFAIADSDPYSLREFIQDGEPAHDCRLLTGPCWTVQHLGYSESAKLLPESGAPGEVDFDVTVLAALSELARKAPEEAELLRVGWRVRFARRVVRWAVTS